MHRGSGEERYVAVSFLTDLPTGWGQSHTGGKMPAMWKRISKLGSRPDGKVRGIERQVDLSRGGLAVAYDGFSFLFVPRYTGLGPICLGDH